MADRAVTIANVENIQCENALCHMIVARACASKTFYQAIATKSSISLKNSPMLAGWKPKCIEYNILLHRTINHNNAACDEVILQHSHY